MLLEGLIDSPLLLREEEEEDSNRNREAEVRAHSAKRELRQSLHVGVVVANGNHDKPREYNNDNNVTTRLHSSLASATEGADAL